MTKTHKFPSLSRNVADRLVAAVHENLFGGLVENGRVAVAPFDRVPLGFDDVPLAVLEVVLL